MEEEIDGRWVVQVAGRMYWRNRLIKYEPTREKAVEFAEREVRFPLIGLAHGSQDSVVLGAKVEVVASPKARAWRPAPARRVAQALVLRRGWKGFSGSGGFVIRRGRLTMWLENPEPDLLGPVFLRRLARLTGLQPTDLRTPEVLAIPTEPSSDSLRDHERLARRLRKAQLRDSSRSLLVPRTRRRQGSPVAWVEVNKRETNGRLTAWWCFHRVAGSWYLVSWSTAAWSIPEGADLLDLIRDLLSVESGTPYEPPRRIAREHGLRPAKYQDVFGPI